MKRILLFLGLATGGVAAIAYGSGGFFGAGSHQQRPEVTSDPNRAAGSAPKEGAIHADQIPTKDDLTGTFDPTRRVFMRGPAVPKTWNDPVTGEAIEFPTFVPWEFEAESMRGVPDPVTGEQAVACWKVHVRLFREPSTFTRAEAEAVRADRVGRAGPVHLDATGEEARADFLRLNLNGRERLPGVRTFVHLTKGVVLTDLTQNLVIRTDEAVLDLDKRAAEGRSRLSVETPDWRLSGVGFRLQEKPSRLEILEQTDFDIRRMAGTAAPAAPGPFDFGSGPFRPTRVTAKGSAVVTRGVGSDAPHTIVLSDTVRVHQDGGIDLAADVVTLELMKRASTNGTNGSSGRDPAGDRASSLRLRSLEANGHVALDSPPQADGRRATSLTAPRMLCDFPEKGLGTTTFLGRTALSFAGEIPAPGGRTSPGTVTATCEESLVYGPPPEDRPEVAAVLSLVGAAHVVSEAVGDARPQTLDAATVRLYLKRPADAGTKTPEVHAAPTATPRSSQVATAFDARGDVRLDGPRVVARADALIGEHLDLPTFSIVAVGKGARIEVLEAPAAAPATTAQPSADGSPPRAARERRDWIPESLTAERDVEARVSGGADPVLLTGRRLHYARGQGGLLEAAPGGRAKVVLDASTGREGSIVGTHIAFDLDAPVRTVSSEGPTEAVFGWGAVPAARPVEKGPRPLARFVLTSGSRIEIAGLRGADALNGLRLVVHDGGRFERFEGDASTDVLAAGSIEAMLFERPAAPGNSALFGGGRRTKPKGGTAPAAVAAGPVADATSHRPTAPWTLRCSQRFAVAFGDGGGASGLAALSSLLALGDVEAHDDATRLLGEKLTFDGRTSEGHLIGRAGGATRVTLGSGEQAQRLSSPEVTFGLGEAGLETARFAPPFAGLFRHVDDQTKKVERFVLVSKDGSLVVEKGGATVDAGAGQVVLTRSVGESGAKEATDGMRMFTSKLTLVAPSLLTASKNGTFDRLVAEGKGTRMEVFEPGKQTVKASGDRVEYDRAGSLVTISAAKGRRVYLVGSKFEGDFRELRYDPTTGLWDLPGAFIRIEEPKEEPK